MNTKSKTCFGKATGKPLAEYRTLMDARQAAGYINQTNDTKMVEYECTKCGQWHLSPASRQTPSIPCRDCNKELYATEQGALQRAKIRCHDSKILLSAYPCPYNDGWHLTSQ